MQNRRRLGVALLFLGGAILIVSAGADVMGLGKAATAFGFKQIAGSVAGAAVAVAGAFLILQREIP